MEYLALLNESESGAGGDGGKGGTGGNAGIMNTLIVINDIAVDSYEKITIQYLPLENYAKGGAGGAGAWGYAEDGDTGEPGAEGAPGSNSYYSLPSVELVRNTTEPIQIADTGCNGAYGKDATGSLITDKIDLSKYSYLFTEEKNFRFDITITMAEVNDGYQEVPLYSANTLFSSSDSVSQDVLNANGYITGKSNIEHGSGAVDKNIYSHTSFLRQ